jgi:hypothetical protein
MITVQRKVKLGQQGRKMKASGKSAVGRIPRVARLMALAIRFDQLIRDGVVADQAELARLGQVTRARLTQIMNLLMLAPDIQGELLFLESRTGRERVSERRLRKVAAMVGWSEQRAAWGRQRCSA